MNKQRDDEQVSVIGWFQPHRSVNWTGEVLDPKTGELVKEPSMTKQSFKEECDINNIVPMFLKTGMAEHINTRAAAFVDLPDTIDYQQALETVIAGSNAFEALPAQIRAKFNNSAANFLAFVEDPNNADELRELGLAHALPEEPDKAPVEVVVVDRPGGQQATPGSSGGKGA